MPISDGYYRPSTCVGQGRHRSRTRGALLLCWTNGRRGILDADRCERCHRIRRLAPGASSERGRTPGDCLVESSGCSVYFNAASSLVAARALAASPGRALFTTGAARRLHSLCVRERPSESEAGRGVERQGSAVTARRLPEASRQTIRLHLVDVGSGDR
jgi:hypothetical protein